MVEISGKEVTKMPISKKDKTLAGKTLQNPNSTAKDKTLAAVVLAESKPKTKKG